MSFFTSSTNRPSFFGISQQKSSSSSSTLSNTTATAATTATTTSSIPIQEKPIVSSNDNYFSFGKFSLSSFAPNFTSNSTQVRVEEVTEEDEEEEETEDEADGKKGCEQEQEQEKKKDVNQNEGKDLPENITSPQRLRKKECEDDTTDSNNEADQQFPDHVSVVDQKMEIIDLHQVSEDGFRIPVGEPKRVKFSSAPKLLKIPLKLTSPTSRFSPKPQINSPEPLSSTFEEQTNDSFRVSRDYSGSDIRDQNISALGHQQIRFSLPVISENHEEYEEPQHSFLSSQSPPTAPSTPAAKLPRTNQRISDRENRTQLRLFRSDPILPQEEESCEVLVDNIINLEKLIENGTNLCHQVEEKVDSSIVELLDQKYRLIDSYSLIDSLEVCLQCKNNLSTISDKITRLKSLKLPCLVLDEE